MLADERAEHLRAELRWLAALLGRARDRDVLLARIRGSDTLAAARTTRASIALGFAF